MEEIINQEIVQRLLAIKGEARGVHFKTDRLFVTEKEGEAGLRRLEEELTRLGCPINYRDVKTLGFYPLGLRMISVLAMKKVFAWPDSKLKELGGFVPYYSFIVRLYMKFFYSIPKIVGQAPKIWKEYFTAGNLTVKEYDESKKYAIFRLEDFNLHPFYCLVLEGYFASITKMVTSSENVTCRETECFFKGGQVHSFLINY